MDANEHIGLLLRKIDRFHAEVEQKDDIIIELRAEIERLRAQYAALFKYADCRACKNRVWDTTCERYLCAKDYYRHPQGCPEFTLKEVDM
jgi:uncharacterized small protein (DUF1192 family)